MANLKHKIAIGTAQFGLDYGIANNSGRVSYSEINSILDLAHNNQIYTLDTAKSYGDSEKYIGNYLKKRKTNWEVITKIRNIEINIIDQIMDSEKKLTIKPKILLAHTANIFLNSDFQLKLNEIKNKQIINKIGVSLVNENEISQILQSKYTPDVVQLPMNILDTKLYRHGVLNKLKENNIEIHVRSVFLQGLFFLNKNILENKFKEVIPYLEKLNSISANAGLNIAELSLLWVLSLNEVSKVIIGVDNAKQLKNHLNIISKKVDSALFDEALFIHFDNEKILTPSLWSTE